MVAYLIISVTTIIRITIDNWCMLLRLEWQDWKVFLTKESNDLQSITLTSLLRRPSTRFETNIWYWLSITYLQSPWTSSKYLKMPAPTVSGLESALGGYWLVSLSCWTSSHSRLGWKLQLLKTYNFHLLHRFCYTGGVALYKRRGFAHTTIQMPIELIISHLVKLSALFHVGYIIVIQVNLPTNLRSFWPSSTRVDEVFTTN